jgi:hypothetical protein
MDCEAAAGETSITLQSKKTPNSNICGKSPRLGSRHKPISNPPSASVLPMRLQRRSAHGDFSSFRPSYSPDGSPQT